MKGLVRNTKDFGLSSKEKREAFERSSDKEWENILERLSSSTVALLTKEARTAAGRLARLFP